MGHYFTNENLPSNIKKIKCNILGRDFIFCSDNGVFSKKGVDFGSRLLLEFIPQVEVGANVLDVGCGYGVLGIVISKVCECHVDMVDINKRALHLAEINLKANKCSNITVFESNVYQNVKDKYNTIITNPPIRAGKKVVYDIVMNAEKFLENKGNLFLVVKKEQGAKSLIIDLEKVYNVSILAKKKGFYIIKCEKLS